MSRSELYAQSLLNAMSPELKARIVKLAARLEKTPEAAVVFILTEGASTYASTIRSFLGAGC